RGGGGEAGLLRRLHPGKGAPDPGEQQRRAPGPLARRPVGPGILRAGRPPVRRAARGGPGDAPPHDPLRGSGPRARCRAGRALEGSGATVRGDRRGDGRRRRVLSETGGIIEECLRSPLPARLKSADILGREVPILFRDEAGVTWSGACDLVYRDGRGVLVVADYKTERPGPDPAAAGE